MANAAQSGYAEVNGLKLYYEIHGSGAPLLLLPGGYETVNAWGQLLPALAEKRQVIAVELQGHGHTADIARPLSYELMADDIAALIQQLGLTKADLIGYSLGGGVALQTAIRHPDVVGKLALISTAFKREGWYPETLAGMAGNTEEMGAMWVGSPMHQAYASVAPHPEDWPKFVGKMGNLLRRDYDWSAGVAALKSPLLIIVGDDDSVQLSHAVEMFGLLNGGKFDVGSALLARMMTNQPSGSTETDALGFPAGSGGLLNARLAVLPDTTHFSIVNQTDMLLPMLNRFLS